MVFLLNIGNTNTQIGSWDGNGRAKLTDILPTRDLTADRLPPDCQIAVASVVPAVREKLTGRRIFLIREAEDFGIDFSQVDMSTLGDDRIANAVALAGRQLPAVCVDCGTAITFELVDRDRIFRGGAIAPGRMLLRKALNSYTAQLPLLEMNAVAPAEPGKNTLGALRLGVDRGVIGTVKEIIDRLQDGFKEKLQVIATGGDSDFIIRHIDGIEPGGEDFTLQGILKIWELNN